jgi:hypothetical protein
MKKSTKCFISYAYVDKEFVYKYIIPVLNELEIDVWVADKQIENNSTLTETIINGIIQCDIVICLINKRSIYVNYEIGAALGNNKPIVAIVNENLNDAFYSKSFNILNFNDTQVPYFSEKLKTIICNLSETVIDKSTLLRFIDHKLIGITVGIEDNDYIEQLSFTTEFVNFTKSITTEPVITLVQTAKGSFKSILSIDLKSFVKLLEKIIFYISELKKRKSERLNIEADTELILAKSRRTDAEAEKIRAESEQIKADTKIKEIDAFFNIIERYKKLGFKIQIGNDILIIQSRTGKLIIKRPLSLE